MTLPKSDNRLSRDRGGDVRTGGWGEERQLGLTSENAEEGALSLQPSEKEIDESLSPPPSFSLSILPPHTGVLWMSSGQVNATRPMEASRASRAAESSLALDLSQILSPTFRSRKEEGLCSTCAIFRVTPFSAPSR